MAKPKIQFPPVFTRRLEQKNIEPDVQVISEKSGIPYVTLADCMTGRRAWKLDNVLKIIDMCGNTDTVSLKLLRELNAMYSPSKEEKEDNVQISVGGS